LLKDSWTNDGSAVAGDAYLNFLIPYIAKMDASSNVLDLQAASRSTSTRSSASASMKAACAT